MQHHSDPPTRHRGRATSVPQKDPEPSHTRLVRPKTASCPLNVTWTKLLLLPPIDPWVLAPHFSSLAAPWSVRSLCGTSAGRLRGAPPSRWRRETRQTREVEGGGRRWGVTLTDCPPMAGWLDEDSKGVQGGGEQKHRNHKTAVKVSASQNLHWYCPAGRRPGKGSST